MHNVDIVLLIQAPNGKITHFFGKLICFFLENTSINRDVFGYLVFNLEYNTSSTFVYFAVNIRLNENETAPFSNILRFFFSVFQYCAKNALGIQNRFATLFSLTIFLSQFIIIFTVLFDLLKFVPSFLKHYI